MNTVEKCIVYAAIISAWLELIWELVLIVRQRRVIMKNVQVPPELIGILSQKQFDKARKYAIDKNTFSFFHSIYLFMVSMISFVWNFLPYLWNLSGDIINGLGFVPGEISQTAGFVILWTTFNAIAVVPLNTYDTFVVEERYGFNNQVFGLKQTLGFYLKDKLKHHTLQLCVVVPIFCTLVHIIRVGGNYFFFYAWFFSMLMTVFLYTIYPDYIAPLFDTYYPLPQGVLKSEIENVAESVGFPLYQISVIEGSKKSAHSNAFIFGVFNRKKIVVFDTLIKDILDSEIEEIQGDTVETPEKKDKDKEKEKEKEKTKTKGDKKKGCDMLEVLAIIAHELGHWKHSHIAKKMFIIQVNMLVCFIIFSYLVQYQGIYEAFGFKKGAPIVVSLIAVLHFLLMPYFGVLSYCMIILSRHCEFQADGFAKSIGKGEHLKCALIKLTQDNLGFPIFDPWYSSWHNSHPPLIERLRQLDKEE